MTATTAIRAAALVTLTALGAGCQSTDEKSGAPAATTAAAPSASTATSPTASPSPVYAANTASVCAAVDKLIIAGSREISADSAAASRQQLTPDQLNAQLRGNLAELADGVRAQAARAQDPEIKALVADTAKRIDAGAKSASPVKWLSSTFVQLPPRLTRECHA